MTALRGLLIAIGVLALWYWLVMATPLGHQAIFAVVPPDGELSHAERIALDRDVTAFVRYLPPASEHLPTFDRLSEAEIRHLEDVHAVNGLLLLYLLPAVLIGLILSRFRLTEPLALTWSLGLVAGIGLVTLVGFDGAFTAIHPFLFPAGNWTFSAEHYLLTRVYPLGFFGVAWTAILLGSALTLWGIRATLTRHEPR